MKVSVVVPVYNTGPGIEALIDSLRAQTLPAEEWEAVFVDDGSSDDTPDLIERLIADDANMRLLREAPSGWPGRPRNVGLDAARGDYVFFSDDDDTLGPESLERLTAFAAEHGSDVVIPRTAGRNRGVPSINRTLVDAQERTALIMSSLAPQKLFRREFLLENGIRFREGHFRLEDHLFVVTAYLRARRVSTYADYPAYNLTYQLGRPHISHQHPDWVGYFGSVRACLDRVDEEGKDERTRRIMRSRWLRVEALSRLRGDGYAQLASPSLLHEVRTLLLDRYDEAQLRALKPIDRMLAFLLVDGRLDDVRALAHWESALRVTSAVTGAEITRGGELRVELRSRLSVAPPPVAGPEGDGRYPTTAELVEHAATFTRIGAEVQHDGTRARWPMEVRHLGDGRALAVRNLTEEPLEHGRWSVLTLAGEHRSRRRRPVALEHGVRIGRGRIRVGEQIFLLGHDGRLRLYVGSTTVPPPPPPSLMRRVARRVPGAVSGVRRVRSMLRRSVASWRVATRGIGEGASS